jgi:hypothetical protein
MACRHGISLEGVGRKERVGAWVTIGRHWLLLRTTMTVTLAAVASAGGRAATIIRSERKSR